MAGAQRGLGELIEARATIQSALGIVESAPDQTSPARNCVLRTLASVRQYYELLVDVLMLLDRQQPSGGFDAEALAASERARARSLIDLLAEARADIREGVDEALLERERSFEQQLDAAAERQARLMSGRHTTEDAAALDKELAGAERLPTKRRAIRSRPEGPRYAALTQVQPLAIADVQKLLDDRTLLLEYALGDERSYLWAVTRTSLTSHELPKRADLEGAARLVYDDLRARQRRPGETQEDYGARVREADARYWQTCCGAEPDGAGAGRRPAWRQAIAHRGRGGAAVHPLRRIACAERAGTPERVMPRELPVPLMVDHEIVNLPSASALAALRRETIARRPAPRTVALLADPVFELDDPRVSLEVRKAAPKRARRPATADLGRALRDVGINSDGFGLPRLLSSRAEAKAITALAPADAAMIAMGFEATRAKAMSAELSQYRIVHFATHGLLNGEHPELSGIVLSLVDQAGRPQNGFLRLHDIYNLDLPAELVVLSACDTGLGKDVKGEGLVGLARGFMYAGAARVVASLWKVDDEASADLMTQFYRRMLENGKPPAAALREAQITIWKQKRWTAPHYWAAFVLQGEWR